MMNDGLGVNAHNGGGRGQMGAVRQAASFWSRRLRDVGNYDAAAWAESNCP
jgi:hypothetical protein